MTEKPMLRMLVRSLLLAAVLVVAALIGLPALAVSPGGNRTPEATAQQTDAGTCMGDVCGISSPCTANDVRFALLETWLPTDLCLFVGDTGTYYFRAQYVASSNQRWDPGVWISQDGGDAKTGSCFHDYLDPPLATSGLPVPPTPILEPPYWDLEDLAGSGDECGDIQQNQPTYHIVGPLTFPCNDVNSDLIIDAIGTCLAWDNNKGNNCPANQNCPGTGSKCNCYYTEIEVNLGKSDVGLVKTAPTDPVEPGDTFQYTIQVTNNGPTYSTGFSITDNLNPWLSYVSYTGVNATCTAAADPNDPSGWGQIVTCIVTEDVPVDGTYNLTLTVQLHPLSGDPPWNVNPPNPLPNSACVQGNELDTNAGNNCDDANITTPVTLAYFRAQRSGPWTAEGSQNVQFDWSTATEVGSVGFNLYAQGSIGRQRLNQDLIPAQAGDTLLPRDYHYQLSVPEGESFWIEEIGVRGQAQSFGPFDLDAAYGRRPAVEPIDWAAIGSEHLAALAQQRSSAIQELQATPTVNLLVDRDGLYRVTYEALLAAGFDLLGAPSASLAVTNAGAPVPIRVQAGQQFGPGSFVEFVGRGLSTLYTHSNVYTLQVDPGLAERVTIDRTRPPQGVRPPTYYMETVTVDRNQAYSFLSPSGDPWYDTSMMVFATPQSWSFELTADGYAGPKKPATLAVNLWGASEFPQSPDHHVAVALNGVPVADETFDGGVNHPLTVQLPTGSVVGGANTLTLSLPADTGASWDIVNLDRFGLTYPRYFNARDGRLSFTASGDIFRVNGLASSSVVVYRVIDGSVSLLAKVKVGGAPSAYSAVFAGSPAPATYWVSTVGALLVPQIVPARPYADITGGTAGYLVISHPDFLDGLAPWVAARSAQGLDVRVVDVQDVYAQFGFGVFDPDAIRDYIAFAVAHMNTHMVLLVGGDTYDYLDYLGQGSISFIPSLYARTDRYAAWSPVDPLFADVDSDGVPDLPIGRFPVRTSAELAGLIGKTFDYEAKTYGQTAVFAADQSFRTDSESFVTSLPAGWSVAKAYLDELTVEQARGVLLGAVNQGTALTSYVGHSGPSVWSFLGLFSADDAAALTNFDRPTVVTQWGCWNTYYVEPTYNTLAHKWLLSGTQGAAAVLGSTTISYDTAERALGQFLTPRLVQSGTTIGAALQQAKEELAAGQGGAADVLLGWTILGDPALVVQP